MPGLSRTTTYRRKKVFRHTTNLSAFCVLHVLLLTERTNEFASPNVPITNFVVILLRNRYQTTFY